MEDTIQDGNAPTTVSGAASVFERLLSQESTPPARETPPPAKGTTPEPSDEEVEGEAAETSTETPGDPDLEDAPDEEPQETQTPEPELYTVKVNGEELKVTREELLAGYSRTADYTRKTQAHAEAVKQFEAQHKPALIAERQQLAEGLRQIEQFLQDATPQEPDWDKLRLEAPDQFPAIWAEWDQHNKRMAAVRANREAAEAKVRADQEEALRGQLQRAHEALVKAVPEWTDTEKAKAELATLHRYAQDELGFTADELDAVTDHRAILLLRKAYQADQMVKRKAEAKQKLDTVVTATKPGATKPPSKVTELTRQKQRLAKTGRVEDAAGVFLGILKSESP